MSKRGRHTSVEKELKHSIRWLENLPFVNKVVLCLYSSARHRYTPGTLRFQRVAPGGAILKAYGGNGLMDVYVKVAEEHLEDFVKQLSERYD
jgi:hypothetical protein